MSQNNSDWVRSITIASPVLVAALVSLVLAVTTILNPAEATTPATNGGPGQLQEVTATQLYSEFLANEGVAKAKYAGQQVQVSGALAGWGENGLPYITLATDGSGGAFVKCILDFDFTDYTIQQLPDLLGQEVTVTGLCQGLSDGYVIIENGTTNDIPKVEPGGIS